MPSSDQCAIGTNGKLLDGSEIVWYNDAEDQVPINPKATTSSSAPKTTTLHAFFNSGTAGTPAVFDAGARRSSRISKPSKRVLEANNGNPPESSKRPRIAHKQVIEYESEDEASMTSSNAGVDTDVEIEDEPISAGMGDLINAEECYASTKVMGEQDRKVSAFDFIYTTSNNFFV